jgi:tetratricopeptide (TPR) repeat protein
LENIKFKEEELFEDQTLSYGNVVFKATPENLGKELKTVDLDPGLKKETKAQFQTAEELLKDKKHQEAADVYGKSINVHPTMSAYLNQGNALYGDAHLAAASKAYAAGLTLSQKIAAKGFELAFLNNPAVLGHAESNFDESLRYHQAALKILRENGRKNDEANHLLKIGFTCTLKNDLNEAVNYYQAALLFRASRVAP